MSDKEFKKKFKEKMDSISKKDVGDLYPVSDKDIEYIKTSTSKDVGDDGYEEGKSKDREMTVEDLPPASDKDIEILKKRLKKWKWQLAQVLEKVDYKTQK